MAKQLINLGTAGTNSGDTIRSAFDKANDNFNEVYSGNIEHYKTLGYNKIFCLPSDFLMNGDSSTYNYAVSTNGGYGYVRSSSLEPHFNFMIPKGMKATKGRMNGTSFVSWNIYTSALTSSTANLVGSGSSMSFNSEHSFPSSTIINATGTYYVTIKLNLGSTTHKFYGGYILLEEI
tara:strand:+ start:1357 stop:1887 length:531 start_codon:yes stop_codon:yes gene_type:complete